MSELIDGDDGLPANEVGSWADEKHECLRRYVDISRSVRAKWGPPKGAGSVYIDPFCATGRARIKNTARWIDGSAVTAWLKSKERGQPFTEIYIGDIDPVSLRAMETRLKRHGAPVISFLGPAPEVVTKIVKQVNPKSLCFAFLDPYKLESLDFEIIRTLSRLEYIDLLMHVSQMDLQRNLDLYLKEESTALDAFVPGFRTKIDTAQGQPATRQQILGYWRDLVASVGTNPSERQVLVRSPGGNQALYWLMLAAKHEIADRFWRDASNITGQGSLF